ncbi:MAG: DUF87 domain-containing protein [Saprospiraceae bacterium]|nr:DUF87 domain-containing protein [Saprospiraceae bacterium]
MLNSKGLPPVKCRDGRQIRLGKIDDGTSMMLDPLSLALKNTGIFGSSGSGKSWLAGLIAEKLLRSEYQICIIDPEGDYRGLKTFPNTLLLGGPDAVPPHLAEVSTLLEYSDMSLILDLSLYVHEEKISYVEELMTTLMNLRKRRGKPHWFLIDEAHYFCHDSESSLVKMWIERMSEGGFALLSYRPDEIAPGILKHLDHLMVTHLNDGRQWEVIQTMVHERAFKPVDYDHLQSLTDRQVYFFIREGIDHCKLKQGVVEIESTRRTVPHIRHLHKYLKGAIASQ